MPACGQAVGCGVCDTPEIWCGAAGLCARVRACAGAAESSHTYIHTYKQRLLIFIYKKYMYILVVCSVFWSGYIFLDTLNLCMT